MDSDAARFSFGEIMEALVFEPAFGIVQHLGNRVRNFRHVASSVRKKPLQTMGAPDFRGRAKAQERVDLMGVSSRDDHESRTSYLDDLL